MLSCIDVSYHPGFLRCRFDKPCLLRWDLEQHVHKSRGGRSGSAAWLHVASKEIQSGFSYLGWSLGKVSLGNWALWSCPLASSTSGWNWKWRSATDARHETWTSLEEFARVKWWDETPLVPIGGRQALDSWFNICLLWLSAWLSLRSSVLEWWALGYMVACRKSAGMTSVTVFNSW